MSVVWIMVSSSIDPLFPLAECREGFPIHSGGTLQRTYKLTQLMEDNRVCQAPTYLPNVEFSTVMHNIFRIVLRTNVALPWMGRLNMKTLV